MDNTIGSKGSSIHSLDLEQTPAASNSTEPIAAPAKHVGSTEPANPEFMIQAAQKQATDRAAMQNLAGEMQKHLLQSKMKSSDQTATAPTATAPASTPARPFLTPTEKALNRTLDAFDEQSKKVKELEGQLKITPSVIKPALEKALVKENEKLDELAGKLDQLMKMRQAEKDLEKVRSDMNKQLIQNLRS